MKKKLKELKQANGQVVPKQVKSATINAYFGNSGNKFGTIDESEFETKLKSMSANELYEYALNFGIKITDPTDKNERTRGMNALINEFRGYCSFYKVGGAQTVRSDAQKKNEIIRKLML